MNITIGAFEYRPGFLKVGNLFQVACLKHTGQRFRFQFHRPDAEHDEYFLFWRSREIVWAFPSRHRHEAQAVC